MVESAISFVQHFQVVRYVSVAGATILLYDYFLTFVDEVHLIWHSSWSTVKVLYYATRYLCFADTATIFIYQFYPHLNTKSCREVYYASVYLVMAGIVIAEIIMTMRTYALWGRSKRLLISLAVMLLVCIRSEISRAIPAFIYVVHSFSLGQRSLSYFTPGRVMISCVSASFRIIDHRERPQRYFAEVVPSPAPQLAACNAQDPEEVKAAVAFGLLMVYEFVILLLTMWIGVKQWNEGLHRSPLIMQFYRDGVLYFFVLFAASAANFTFRLAMVANGDFSNLLALIQRIFHSVLSARMVLNLRRLANRDLEEQTAQLTAPEFATPSSNIGSGQEATTIDDSRRVSGSMSRARIESESNAVEMKCLGDSA